MQTPLILALDIGTSSVRAALYDCEANVLPKTMVKIERTLDATDDGGAEIDADVAFRQVVAAIDGVLRKAADVEGEITHAATSSFWHSLVGVDEKGKPTTKVLGWADTRSRAYVATLRKKLDEDQVHNRTGARFHSSFWPAKLLWLREEHPEIFDRTTSWMSLSDYVGHKLFGGESDPDPSETVIRCFAETGPPKSKKHGESFRAFTSISMASATGIFDIRQCDWDRPLIKYLGISRDQLPSLFPLNGIPSGLERKYQRRWKRLRYTDFFAAIGDGAANNIGAGCVTKTKAALMIGTSGAMRVAYKGKPPGKIPSGLWCYRIDRERVIMGGALSDGGGLYRWLKDNLKLEGTDDALEAEIAKRPPASHGLAFLPFLAGERSTGYHQFAAGAIIGLHTSTDTVDIVQAALESVAYRFADVFEQLNRVAKISDIIASGGALRESPVWTQIIADVLGRKLTLPDTQEASSRGVVLLALESIGRIEDIQSLPLPKGKSFEPAAARRKAYAGSRERHQHFYELILDNDTKP